jgi:hypothetical protein
MTAKLHLPSFLICLILLSCSPSNSANQDGTQEVVSGTDGTIKDLVILSDTGELPGLDGDIGADTDALVFPDATDPDAGVLCQLDGGFGCPCDDPDDCLAGWCVDSPFGKVCTITCIEECPLGWDCAQAASDVEPVFICLPPHLWLCRPCLTSEECFQGIPDSGDKCVNFGPQGAFCGGQCVGNEDCPEGFSCVQQETVEGGFSMQCVPDSLVCECTPKFTEVGSWTSCEVVNEYGSCDGQRSCAPEGLTECSGPSPLPEDCNGLDDDCDGDIDEEVTTLPCDVENEFGICVGETVCLDGESGCVGIGATPEACNGKDDDCDGDTDEIGAAGCLFYHQDGDGDGYGGPETGCVCGPTEEYPANVEDDCDDTNPDVHPGAQELCATPFDDNCDTLVNDDTAQDCTPYFLDTDQDGYGVGAAVCLCAPKELLTATEAGDCDDDDTEAYPFLQEKCDGKDNNCNGSVDEQYPDYDQDGIMDCVDDDDDNDGAPDITDCQPFNNLVPSCLAKECGDDGCGGNCGLCPGNSTCEDDFKCSCLADCTGKQCGDDGCGGSCGNCPPNWVCQDGACQCLPNCLNKECGSDGCGGNCGNCPPGHACQNGFCICQPTCVNKQCGDDGCGGTCGTCAVGYDCHNNQCQCQPQCLGKQCGSDSCGGLCGTCPQGYNCDGNGQCQGQPNPCGTITWAGQCLGNTLQYCHSPGNTGAPCYSAPNCQLSNGDCDTDCFNSGYWGGTCECGINYGICAPDNYCCYCTCY